MQISLLTKIKIALYVLKNAITKPTFSEYDPDDVSGFYPDPNPLNSKMLHQHPVFFAPKLAAWVCSLNREQTFAMAKDSTFSVSFNDWRFAAKPRPDAEKDALDKVLASLLMALPPKDHMRIRRLVQPAFLPRNIVKMDAVIIGIIDDALADLPRECNMAEVIHAIPLRVIAALVGVPETYQREFKGLADSILATYSPTIDSDRALAQQGLQIVREVIESRRDKPTDDFISVLIQTADEDGDRLSIDEVMAFVASLLTAGPDTTAHFLNFTLQTCLAEPGLKEALIADPGLIPNAVSEASRVNYFAHSGGVRFATKDVLIGGQTIKKGEMIKFNVNTANLDPAVFPDPLTFNMHRSNLKEAWMFGAGSHFCVGAALARSIGEHFVERFLATYPAARLAGEPCYQKDFISRKMTDMPVQLYQ
ncbi:MAG TPA: cytochrome P450 [Pseudomonadales bacterium]